MSLLHRVAALEQRQPLETDIPRILRFVAAGDEPREPITFTDHAGWRCDRDSGESAEDHRARAVADARQRCAGRMVLFES